MKLLALETWRDALLPKSKRVKWTWKKCLLFAFAISMLVDSFLVPFHGEVDPGGAGAGMLFLILGFRAASASNLPLSVVLAGGCSVALTLAMNHRVLKSPSILWTSIAIVLTLIVAFWGLVKPNQCKTPADSAKEDPGSILHLDGKGKDR